MQVDFVFHLQYYYKFFIRDLTKAGLTYHAYRTDNGFGTLLPFCFNPFRIRLGTVHPVIVFVLHKIRNAINQHLYL